jgi:hypothetical protein
MRFVQKSAAELQTAEIGVHSALKAWYMSPGVQRELRRKENEAVQMVLEILERRRAWAQKAIQAE